MNSFRVFHKDHTTECHLETKSNLDLAMAHKSPKISKRHKRSLSKTNFQPNHLKTLKTDDELAVELLEHTLMWILKNDIISLVPVP